MTNPTTYLKPGFLVALTPRRYTVRFIQLPPNLRKPTPVRIAVIEAFSRGYTGSIEDLVVDVAKRLKGHRPAVREFIAHLADNGYLTDAPPEKIYGGQDSGATGVVHGEEIAISAPVNLVTQDGEYLWYDHDGNLRLRLSMPEVFAASMFTEPVTVKAAREEYLALEISDRLTAAQFDVLVSRLAGAGLIQRPHNFFVKETPLFFTVEKRVLQAHVDKRVAAHDAMVAETGKNLVQVIPVNDQVGTTPAALGLLMAYAMEYDNRTLRDKFNFVPMFLADDVHLLARAATPGVYLFSNYLWTLEENMKLSALVRAMNPANITIHGGPSTPSYEKDCEKFFADNPHVDITVRGEGEQTFTEILLALDPSNMRNLDVLQNVNGLTYRTANGVRRTAERERIVDLDTIPSPYLMGLFDDFGAVHAGAVIESNRGCPYGCTFCDWGSATLSRVRRFDLDRVFKELEWSAKNQIEDASLADANFGMLERDVSIAEKIAELKRAYGFPRSVGINYAKNQVTYLRQIIKIFADVGILSEGKISLQTMDATTLKVIDRSNIKLEKYNELSTEFRRAKLPLIVEMLMGLPGATTQAFHNDLQECADRDMRVLLHHIMLLPNSPMNDPEYRKEHGIVARAGEYLKEAATYTRKEWDEMNELRNAFYLLDSFGVLRYVARFVRREKGIREVEFYDQVQSDVLRNSRKWPVFATVLRSTESYMAPPGSWALFIAEVRRYLVEELGIADDSALRTTLAVQHAHLPAPGRVFPHTITLEHDYAAWWELVLTTREEGHRTDWEKHVPQLRDFGPGTLVVDDPNAISIRDVGVPLNVLLFNLRSWELDSPVARPRVDLVAS